MFRTLDETIRVSGQIAPEDIATAAAQGARTIVNNRPDGEQPDQPDSAEIEAAADAAGLGYVHIPVDASGLTRTHIDRMAAALEAGPVLAFCRSGTRSTNLWAVTRALAGDDPAQIVAKAANAGYDVAALVRQVTGG